MAMHANSLMAHAELDIAGRNRVIYEAFLAYGQPMTDRHCMRGLGKSDPNWVRPRITWLVQHGYLVEVGSVKDIETGKTVRECRAVAKC